MLRVNNNISAINAQRSIGRNNMGMQRQLERLSSGLRVNRAADDASGLVVSEGMRGELSGLRQNVRNAEQASNLLQVAEGSLQVVNNVLVRMRELSVQSANSTINDSNRESLGAEFNQLVAEVDRIGLHPVDEPLHVLHLHAPGQLEDGIASRETEKFRFTRRLAERANEGVLQSTFPDYHDAHRGSEERSDRGSKSNGCRSRRTTVNNRAEAALRGARLSECDRGPCLFEPGLGILKDRFAVANQKGIKVEIQKLPDTALKTGRIILHAVGQKPAVA